MKCVQIGDCTLYHGDCRREILPALAAGSIDCVVTDPPYGHGWVGVAGVRTGRKFIGVEIEECYFDIACRRIQAEYDRHALFVDPPKAVQLELS